MCCLALCATNRASPRASTRAVTRADLLGFPCLYLPLHLHHCRLFISLSISVSISISLLFAPCLFLSLTLVFSTAVPLCRSISLPLGVSASWPLYLSSRRPFGLSTYRPPAVWGWPWQAAAAIETFDLTMLDYNLQRANSGRYPQVRRSLPPACFCRDLPPRFLSWCCCRHLRISDCVAAACTDTLARTHAHPPWWLVVSAGRTVGRSLEPEAEPSLADGLGRASGHHGPPRRPGRHHRHHHQPPTWYTAQTSRLGLVAVGCLRAVHRSSRRHQSLLRARAMPAATRARC